MTRPPPSCRSLSLSLLLVSSSSGGCAAGDGSPAWALQHAEVEVASGAGGALRGYQTWDLFASPWARKQGAEHHLCALVEELAASPVAEPDCPGCRAGFAVQATLLETDCSEEQLASLGEAAGAAVDFLLGDPPDAVEDLDPDPGRSLGWYLRWPDQHRADPQGFAWPSEGGAPSAEAIVQGGGDGGWLTLSPAYAWELSGP